MRLASACQAPCQRQSRPLETFHAATLLRDVAVDDVKRRLARSTGAFSGRAEASVRPRETRGHDRGDGCPFRLDGTDNGCPLCPNNQQIHTRCYFVRPRVNYIVHPYAIFRVVEIFVAIRASEISGVYRIFGLQKRYGILFSILE